MIVQLKNGNWIDPLRVTQVNLLPPDSVKGDSLTRAGSKMWRVVVSGDDTIYHQVTAFRDYDEAAQYRDYIARTINEEQRRHAAESTEGPEQQQAAAEGRDAARREGGSMG